MRFITYFELNEEYDPAVLAEIGQTLLEKKLYPAPGVENLAWYLTPGHWGISIAEAEKVEDLMSAVEAWRIAKPGIFKFYKIQPALETRDVIKLVLKLARKVKT